MANEITGVIGENPIQQQYSDTCAIKSQQLIMQEFGIDVSETQLVEIAAEAGIYQSGEGTPMGYTGVLLDQVGIPVSQMESANIFDLTNELAQGHKVIIGVDSGELWAKSSGLGEQFKEWWDDLWGNNEADHALIVSSIDNQNPDDPQVVLTDPGSGEIRHYPLDEFMDAWKDSNCFMVSTDVAPAEFTAMQIQNNQPISHLADIGGVSYNDFQYFHDISQSLPPMDIWDYTANPFHPIHSLMDTYTLCGDNVIGFSDFGAFDFYQHVDIMQLSNYLTETSYNNYNFLSQSFPDTMSSMQADLAALPPDDPALVHDFFEHYDVGDNTEISDFTQSQAHAMELCDLFGIEHDFFLI
ncbi:MAG: hypothetical protein LBM07_07140 [Culturomica sp.]|jgi:hypothetical protein|nr:hypothetical protein [Culturomica sp.]